MLAPIIELGALAMQIQQAFFLSQTPTKTGTGMLFMNNLPIAHGDVQD